MADSSTTQYGTATAAQTKIHQHSWQTLPVLKTAQLKQLRQYLTCLLGQMVLSSGQQHQAAAG